MALCVAPPPPPPPETFAPRSTVNHIDCEGSTGVSAGVFAVPSPAKSPTDIIP